MNCGGIHTYLPYSHWSPTCLFSVLLYHRILICSLPAQFWTSSSNLDPFHYLDSKDIHVFFYINISYALNWCSLLKVATVSVSSCVFHFGCIWTHRFLGVIYQFWLWKSSPFLSLRYLNLRGWVLKSCLFFFFFMIWTLHAVVICLNPIYYTEKLLWWV